MSVALAVINTFRADHAALLELVEGDITQREHAAIQADALLKRSARSAREAWALQAKLVYVAQVFELWRYHPAGFNSFIEWCQQPEIDLSASVVSDMMALCDYAPLLAETGIDIWHYVIEHGQSKVRQLVPLIRQAAQVASRELPLELTEELPLSDRYDIATLDELVRPSLEALAGSSYRDVLEMVSKRDRDVRISFDPKVRYIPHDDGSVSLVFEHIDTDELDHLLSRVKITRWANAQGQRIPCPLGIGATSFNEGGY